MTFLGVTTASGFFNLDIQGMVGLGPAKEEGDLENLDNFVRTLYFHQMIDNNTFGLYLKRDNQT